MSRIFTILACDLIQKKMKIIMTKQIWKQNFHQIWVGLAYQCDVLTISNEIGQFKKGFQLFVTLVGGTCTSFPNFRLTIGQVEWNSSQIQRIASRLSIQCIVLQWLILEDKDIQTHPQLYILICKHKISKLSGHPTDRVICHANTMADTVEDTSNGVVTIQWTLFQVSSHLTSSIGHHNELL